MAPLSVVATENKSLSEKKLSLKTSTLQVIDFFVQLLYRRVNVDSLLLEQLS